MHREAKYLPSSSSSVEINPVSEEEIDFLGYSESYFVSFIDIVNSTNIVSHIEDSPGIRKYYGIFLNTLARIARSHGGKILKSAGDSLIIYFPNTSDSMNSDGFKEAMSCCSEIIEAHRSMNLVSNNERLPNIDYRLSADYGKVEVAKSRSSAQCDLLGHTMNICAKMNSRAKPQGFVIGSDLYEILKGFKFPFDNHYTFQLIGEYSSGLKYSYPIFAVTSKNNVRDWLQIQRDPTHDESSIKSRHRIMVVDDEPDLLLTYKNMLEDDALFEVETYVSSQDALQRLFTKGLSSFDLIITDIRMPQPNGLQLYNIIKSLNKRANILFITAYDVIEEVVSVLPDVKHEDILKKPVSKHDLLKEAKHCMA